MRRFFVVLVLAFALLTTPLMAKDNLSFEPQVSNAQPIVVFPLEEGLTKLKSASDCGYFSFYDCYIHYGARWNPNTNSFEIYPDYANLIIYCSLTGTYHSVRLDLTSSIM